MSILNLDTRILGIGITGARAERRVEEALNYGSPIVAGVTKGKGGMRLFGKIPIYNTVAEALEQHPELNFLMCYVGIENVLDVFQDALPTKKFSYGWYNAEGVQMLDALKIVKLGEKYGTQILQGIGMVDPRCRVGIGNLQFTNFRYIDDGINCAVISKSGGYTGDKVKEIRTQTGDGCAFATSISGEKTRGTGYISFLEALRHDEGVDYIFIYGEIGGNLEEQACRWLIQERYEKPVIFDIGGWGTDVCPAGMSLGHADAIIGEKGEGSLDSKIAWACASGSYVNFIPSPMALKDEIDKMKSDVLRMGGFKRHEVWNLNETVVKEYEARHGHLDQNKKVRVIKEFPEKLGTIRTVHVQEPYHERLLERGERGTVTAHDVVIRRTEKGLETLYGGIPLSVLVEKSNLAINYAFFIYCIPFTAITKNTAEIIQANYRKIHDNNGFDIAPAFIENAKTLFAQGRPFNVTFSNAIDGIIEPDENSWEAYRKDTVLRNFIEKDYQSPTDNKAEDIKNGYIIDLIRMVRCAKIIGQVLRANKEFRDAQEKINKTYSNERLRELEARMKNPTIEALQFYDIAGRPPSPEQENVYRAFSIASISNGRGTLSSESALRTYGGSGNKVAAISTAVKTMGINHGGAGEQCVKQLHYFLVQYFKNLQDNSSYIETLNCKDIEGKPIKIHVQHDKHFGNEYDLPDNPLLDLARAFVADFEGEVPEAHNPDRIRAFGRGHPVFNYNNRDLRVTSCDAILSDEAKRDPAYMFNQAVDIAYVLQKIDKHGPDGVMRAPVQNVDGAWANILAGHYHIVDIDSLLNKKRREGALDIYYLAAMALFHLPRIAGINSQINYSQGGFELRIPEILIRDLTRKLKPEQIESAITNWYK